MQHGMPKRNEIPHQYSILIFNVIFESNQFVRCSTQNVL